MRRSRKKATHGSHSCRPPSPAVTSGSPAKQGTWFRSRVLLGFVFLQVSLDVFCVCYWFRTIVLIQRFSTLAAHCDHMRELKKYCCLGRIPKDSDFISPGQSFLHGKVIKFTSVVLNPGYTLKPVRDPLSILMLEPHNRPIKNGSLG